MFRISPGSAVPIYEQIKEHLRYRIALGQYAAGARLPAKRQLAKELGVNVHTVGKVYEQLEDEGLVVARHGSGVYVTDQLLSIPQREKRDTLSEIAASSLRRVIGSGLGADDFVAELHKQIKGMKSAGPSRKTKIIFVECNREQCRDYTQELSRRLHARIEPVLLHNIRSIRSPELVITTAFHYDEVRKALRGKSRSAVSIVVHPKKEVLERIHNLRVPVVGFVCRDARSLSALTRQVRTLANVDIPIMSCTADDAGKLSQIVAKVKALVYMPPCRSQIRRMTKGRRIALIEWAYSIDEKSIEQMRRLIGRRGPSPSR